ncbi:MAG: peptide MFS transporter [Azospirillaceae bacterium]|nr:peptide MFS transporter [Azospirillaceae bacterium]
MTGTTFLGHPRGLAYIIFTEAWERFSFYGMQALLVLYMTGHLLKGGTIDGVVGLDGFRQVMEGVVGPLPTAALATQIFGLYGGLTYLTPIFGGLVGDRWLGRGRSVILGAALMAAGHFVMVAESAFLLALLLLILGCGLLKGNLAAQVGTLYDRDDHRRDAAFSLYYMAINLGACIAPLVCGTLGEIYGWHYGFTAAGIGMVVGLVIYLAGRRHLPPDAPAAEPAAGAQRLGRRDLPVMAALLLILVTVTLFWTVQTQVWTTYVLWIQDRVDRTVMGGLEMPITWFQSVDTFAVLALAPVSLVVWRWLDRRGREPGDLAKLAIGYALFGCACLWLVLAELSSHASSSGHVAIVWPLLFHFICASGYLHVAPIALALFTRAGPPSVNAMMVGVYYLSIFAGSLLSGWLGRFYDPDAPAWFWLLHAAIVGAGALPLLLFKRTLGRILFP